MDGFEKQFRGVLELARREGLEVERDPSALEEYPENKNTELWRINLYRPEDMPVMDFIDIRWQSDTFPKYYLVMSDREMKETTKVETARRWVKRYGRVEA